uniref:Reverse transcriptase domain-containing protein n=1 Tax=Arundo donax TaxID=35708 RepID=A0A0A8YT32_ARUDO
MMFQQFYVGQLDVSRLNYGIFTLLPKVVEATRIQQFRPICLLICIYKWITKVLTIRIEPYMKKLTNKCQNAFIKGRNIMDGVLSLHEILHDTKQRKQTGIILKLDFEKVYDKVNWDFLFQCIDLRGFSPLWKQWLRQVVCNGTLSVKLNDQTSSYFTSHKGVRQGNPLSPFFL